MISEATDLPTSRHAIPNCLNLWDTLPTEIKTKILDLSDPLTQHLNGHHPSIESKARDAWKHCNDIWAAALEMEWDGDLRTLPGEFNPMPPFKWCTVVRSKSMYNRLLSIYNLNTLLLIPIHHAWTDLIEPHESHVDIAAENGSLKYMLHLESVGTIEISEGRWHRLAFSLAFQGRTEEIRYLLHTRPSVVKDYTVNGAAAGGNLDLLKILNDEANFPCTETAMDYACVNGNLPMVRYIFTHTSSDPSTICSQQAMDKVAQYGHLHVLQFLHESNNNGGKGCTTFAMDAAAGSGRLDIVTFLHENRPEGCTEKAMDWAASHGHLDVVEFLHAHRKEGCTEKAMNGAAENGHLGVVKFLHYNRLEGCTTDAIDKAAQFGHLEVVKFLHFQRREGCTVAAMDEAAGLGHLEVVRFLHENRKEGCTVDAMNLAAKEGYFEVVKYLAENRREGCSRSALYDARSNGHDEIYEFLVDKYVGS
ncbi:hypothetical protein HDV05_004745 [Chytridiales sp. JEL 0842]|nr:hypothetical protein HDV05_004745 [Chytridiales sp. JEL 0842]